MLLSLYSLAYEVFRWITMQIIPQNQVKHRTFLSFPISVYNFQSKPCTTVKSCQNRSYKAISTAHELLKQKRFAVCCSLFPPSHSAGRTSDKSKRWEKVKTISSTILQDPKGKQPVILQHSTKTWNHINSQQWPVEHARKFFRIGWWSLILSFSSSLTQLFLWGISCTISIPMKSISEDFPSSTPSHCSSNLPQMMFRAPLTSHVTAMCHSCLLHWSRSAAQASYQLLMCIFPLWLQGC